MDGVMFNDLRKRLSALRDLAGKPGFDEALSGIENCLETAAEESRSLWSVFEHSIDGVAIFDDELKLSYCNSTWRVMHGYDAKQTVKGLSLDSFHFTGNQNLPAMLKEKGKFSGEMVHLRKDGRQFIASVSAGEVKSADGTKSFGLVEIARDITMKRLAERRVQESEYNLRKIFENVNDSIFIRSLAGVLLEVNEAACKLLGRTREELIGKNPSEMQIVKISTLSEQPRESLLKTGRAFFETEMLRRDGTPIPVEVNAVLIKYSSTEAALSVVRDISVRKMIQNLREREVTQLQSLLESLPTALFILDRHGRVLRVNKASQKMLGAEPEKGLDICAIERLKAQGFVNDFNDALSGKLVGPKEYVINPAKILAHAIDRDFYLKATVFPVFMQDSGKAQMVAVMTEDITDWRMTEKALDASERRFDALVKDRRLTVMELNSEGKIVKLSAGFQRFCQDRPENAVNRLFEEYISPGDRETWRRYFEDVEMGKAATSPDLRLVFGNGDEWLNISLTPYGTSLIGIAQDATVRKKAEIDIIKAKEAAEEATRLKSEFLTNMSHEFRTPLNAVIGMAHLLLDTKLDSEQAEFTNAIVASGEHLTGIINEILDISKAESGKATFNPMSFDLSKTVHEVAQIMAVKASEKSLMLWVDCDPAIPQTLRGDEAKLRQVLINFVGNAIKFTDKGFVKIEVTTKGNVNGRFIAGFVVEDSGIGIPKDYQEKVFEKFTQVDASSTRRHGGTGLGLAICRELVQLMGGGKIHLESESGRGSKFSFTLPFDLDEEHVNAGKTDASTRILLVEDNAVNQKLMLKMLSKLGFSEVDCATNGQEALERYKPGIHQVVFMDCQMPIMDGYEATRGIRKIEESAKTVSSRIIAMTANDMDEGRERCRLAGMDDYISKPLRKERIIEVLGLDAEPPAPIIP